MKKNLFRVFTVAVCITTMYGCKADLDLKNIDSRIQAEMGVALPVGSMTFTVNDFLGGGQVPKIFVDETGTFHYIDTADIPTKHYHILDLTEYISETDKAFMVYDQLQANGYLNADGSVKESYKGKPITLNFPLRLQLDHINSDINQERIDSVQVSNAKFTSVVNVTELGLQWGWIDAVEVELGDQFTRRAGNMLTLYSKGDGYNYGDSIPANIDQFTVNLMKDKGQPASAGNVIGYCDFTFHFTFTIPTGQPVTIQKDQSAFDYHFAVQFIDFDAAWGYFQASAQMRDSNTVCIDSLWDGWKNFKKMTVRLAEPSLDIYATHHVAAPLMVRLDELVSLNATESRTASWRGQTYNEYVLDNVISPYGALSDSVENHEMFDEDPSNGHLDQLFEIKPDSLKYKFRLMIDPYPHPNYKWAQHRLTNQYDLNGYVVIDIPFKVNEKSEAQYLTQINDIRFDKIALDSLLSTVKVVEKGQAKHIKLYLSLENSLPFDVDAQVWFLKADSSVMDLHLFENMTGNKVHLPAPEMTQHGGEKYSYVSKPSVSTFIVDVDQQQFDSLTQCKHMRLDAYVGNNPKPCAIDTTSAIKAHVGVAADVEAIMNFNKKED
ncbi:MAG: hypothetical protein MJZ75_04565 [Paludibacteraceae bacterium]|nr:hypothetical protein [Paludibacteraceae bacterium]